MNRAALRVANDQPALYPELGANTTDRRCGELPITGSLPRGLRGVLYRNGPGLFRRADRTRQTVLDGDGVLQRLPDARSAARNAA